MRKTCTILVVFCFFAKISLGQSLKSPLVNKIDSLEAVGDYTSALAISMKLVDEMKQRHGEISLQSALAERNIGLFLGKLGKPQAADSVLVGALAICQKAGSPEGLEAAEILNNRSEIVYEQGDYEEALRLLKRVEAIRVNKLGEKHINTLGVRNNIANILTQTGQLKEAEKIYHNCMAVCEQNGLTNHNFYLNFLGGMADVLHWQGKCTQGIAYHNKAIAWAKNKYGDNSMYYINTVTDLIATLNDAGRLASADSLQQVEVWFWKNVRDTLRLSSAMRNWGILQMQLGLFSEAKTTLFEANDLLSKFSENKTQYANSLEGIGMYYHLTKDYKSAEKYYKSAESVLANNPVSALYRTILLRHLELMLDCKRDAAAISMLEEIEKINAQVEIQAIENTTLLEMKALLAKNQQNCEASVSWYDKAIAFETSTFYNKETIAGLLQGKAGMYAGFGKTAEALATLQELVNIRKSTVFALIPLLSDYQRQKISNDLESDFSLWANLLQTTPADDAQVIELINLELYYKNLLEYASKKTQTVVLNSRDTSLLFVYNQWLDLREQINYAYQLPAEDVAVLQIDLPQLEAEIRQLERSFADRGIDNLQQEKTIDWLTIRDALQPGEAALDIMRFQLFQNGSFCDTAIYAISIIKPGATRPELVFLENGNEIESFVAGQYQSEISRKKDISAAVYEKMWAPVAAHLDGVSALYFSPDGIFHKINLNTLRQPDGTYLADRLAVIQVTNLRHVLERSPANSGTEPGTAAFFGDPAFGNTTTSGPVAAVEQNYRGVLEEAGGNFKLTPLPGSKREVEQIAQKLSAKKWQPVVFTGAQATEDTLKKCKSPKVLHIATHGYFLNTEKRTDATGFASAATARNPALRSMLFFAGAENALNGQSKGRNDGILTAFEAAVLPLDGTELVVLSACNTGLGKIQNGEGVFGLQRAFRIAGAKSLIMSLWEVEDTATELFMNNFYEHWTSGMSKTAAFHKAQLALKAKYPQPFYWGSFVLVNG